MAYLLNNYPTKCGNRAASLLPGASLIRFEIGWLSSTALTSVLILRRFGNGTFTPRDGCDLGLFGVSGRELLPQNLRLMHLYHSFPQLHAHLLVAVISRHPLH